MSKNTVKKLVVIIAVIIASVSGYFVKENVDTQQAPISANLSAVDSDTLSVFYVDVGQGDCEFIRFPNGKFMLIDAGEAENASQLTEKLQALGCEVIDYLVVTHPHTDHMGAMADIIEAFEIGEIYMPRASATTKTYENLLQTVKNEGLSITAAKAGKQIFSESELTAELLAPVSDSYEDINNYSAVVKITYKSSSFLFTGDAEKLSEQEMIKNNYKSLHSDVLKVGHHGSRYSSCTDFLKAVSPKYAVIECGVDNSYGHPHSQALKRLNEAGAKIYSTAQNGDIRIDTQGNGEYNVTEKCFEVQKDDVDN